MLKISIIIFVIITFIGPLYVFLFDHIDLKSDYRTANRSSTQLAPHAKDYSDAIIQVYAARAFNWRGIFALHLWVAIKQKNEQSYRVYQVVGWRTLRGLSALSDAPDIPDRLWFNQKPKILLDIRGPKAELLIPKILSAVKRYPYPNEYKIWPGPNSNSFIAYIAREVPELHLALPSNAAGKDFVGSQFFVKAPSGTGYQFSLYGYFGITLAFKEGLEINLLGLVYGINPITLTIKLPGFGDLNIKGRFI